MFAGHVGAALAIGRAERRVNVGIFAFAAMLLDFALWIFVLLGCESVTIPANFADTHQPGFVFPYSHGLLASMVWSALAGIVVAYLCATDQRLRCALLVGAAVLSHWILDALTHVPELSLTGPDSTRVGLGLWQIMPAALAVEGFIMALGLWLFASGAGLSKPEKIALFALCALIYAATVAGMTIAPPPPSIAAMAGSSLAMIVFVSAILCWIGKRHLPRRQSRAGFE